MAKYKVVYDRKNCTGVAACNIVAERFWTMAEDGKANLLGAKEVGDGLWELDIDEGDLQTHLEAARHCPMLVIKIIDLKGKEVLFQRV